MTSLWKAKVINNFSKYADNYDQHSEIQNKIAIALSKDLPQQANEILEIGCGTGHLTTLLATKYKGKQLHITDMSAIMLKKAQKKLSKNNINITFSILDAEKEKTNKTYDLIVGNMVCHWFENFQQGLNNLRSMLKDNGTIFVTIPGPKNFLEWQNALHKTSTPCGLLDFQEHCGVYKKAIFLQQITSAQDFLFSIKKAGASTGNPNYRNLDISSLRKACKEFNKSHKGNITWEINFLRISKKDIDHVI